MGNRVVWHAVVRQTSETAAMSSRNLGLFKSKRRADAAVFEAITPLFKRNGWKYNELSDGGLMYCPVIGEAWVAVVTPERVK